MPMTRFPKDFRVLIGDPSAIEPNKRDPLSSVQCQNFIPVDDINGQWNFTGYPAFPDIYCSVLRIGLQFPSMYKPDPHWPICLIEYSQIAAMGERTAPIIVHMWNMGGKTNVLPLILISFQESRMKCHSMLLGTAPTIFSSALVITSATVSP